MKTGNSFTKYGILLTGILVVLVVVDRAFVPHTPSDHLTEATLPVTIEEEKLAKPQISQSIVANEAADSTETPVAGWINNDGQFTEQTTRLLSWVESGQPLDISISGQPLQRFGFREKRVTAENFQISTGANSVLASEYRVYSGRELGMDGLGDGASLALVNGALSMTVTKDGIDYLIETDPATGELYAVALQSFDTGHSCAESGCGSSHGVCELSADGTMATVSAPDGVGVNGLVRIPVDVLYPGDRLDVAGTIEAADEPDFESGTAGKPYLRNGAEYGASLKDILVLMISAKSQTGVTSGLSSKAATYFAITARAADIYERQLGLRYMMQELVLIPSDSAQDDPGNPSGTTLGDDLYHLQSWINANRPQSTYKWGHAALWTLVDGGGGGVVGLAWTDSYGSASYGHSTQELNWGWSVHCHELGHNVGSSHSSGGVMNPSLLSGNENFFTTVSGQSYTSAKDIYNYMANRSYVFGPAAMRHPEEIPFGVDDTLATPAGTTITFDAIANDLVSVAYGATNTLRLVEVGQVYPKAAGSAKVVDGMVEFTFASGFTGQAWMTYSVGGDVGNNGNGWLHRADVVITVGGDSTAPTTTPALSLANDFISSELTSPIRINPLLNDEGSGRMWAGDIEVVISPTDTTPESYSYNSFWMVDANVVTGTGSLSLETHNMTRGSNGGNLENTGYLTYTPGANEGAQVVIEYTVMDASGNTASAQVIFAGVASVGVDANYLTTAEDSGDVISFTFSRTASADTSVEEVISFSVSGSTTPSGVEPDYALAGHDSFDPVSGNGTVLIPVGELSSTILMAVANDGVTEGQETMILDITSASSLLVSSASDTTTIWINDDSLVYYESFDSFTTDSGTWNGWSNLKNKNASGKGGDDWFDWEIGSNSTATSGTGPSADNTTGSGKYFYAEASNHVDEYTILESPVINTSGVGAGNLEFWYHMLGSNMGSLTVELYANGSLVSSSFFSASGQQSSNGTDWKQAVMDLSPYLPATSLQLRFRADIGSGELSDIAIDDLKISAQSSSLPQFPNIMAEPSGCIAEVGQSVYLSVIPQGFPVPQVQWYRNGVAIPGATGAAHFISSMDEASVGTYEAAVSNSEGAVLSFAAAVTLPSNTFFTNWTSANGLTEANMGSDSDPDFDGVLNIFEFAFNMDPNTSSQVGMPVVQTDKVGNDTYLYIVYNRLVGWAGKDMEYIVETSTDMSTDSWNSEIDVDVEEISSEVQGDVEVVTARRKTPINSGSAFLRVNVVLE